MCHLNLTPAVPLTHFPDNLTVQTNYYKHSFLCITLVRTKNSLRHKDNALPLKQRK